LFDGGLVRTTLAYDPHQVHAPITSRDDNRKGNGKKEPPQDSVNLHTKPEDASDGEGLGNNSAPPGNGLQRGAGPGIRGLVPEAESMKDQGRSSPQTYGKNPNVLCKLRQIIEKERHQTDGYGRQGNECYVQQIIGRQDHEKCVDLGGGEPVKFSYLCSSIARGPSIALAPAASMKRKFYRTFRSPGAATELAPGSGFQEGW
jgi:hypothetical protein